MEKFVVNRKANGEFQFDFVNKNGEVILSSGGYTRKFMCIKGIESVKNNSQDSTKFFKKTNSKEERYFNLKAFNGKIIGTSKMFKDRDSRDAEILEFRKYAPEAIVEDQSNAILESVA
ncbi:MULTISPECIES: YegP family protein [unclassified Flavobacterium]|uniref:YegP family protein n=1 Tax=unclassified Flavobacterium TaxID=196869 RepID=UPI002222D164|nr:MULTISPECIES: YegP family protein [unclassified Flavobacterium]